MMSLGFPASTSHASLCDRLCRIWFPLHHACLKPYRLDSVVTTIAETVSSRLGDSKYDELTKEAFLIKLRENLAIAVLNKKIFKTEADFLAHQATVDVEGT
jgi:hypothetical protein